MFPLLRPLFFARRVRRALLAVPGVEGVRVYREVTIRRVVEVTGNNPEGVASWEYQMAVAVEDTMKVLGGFVSHDLQIGPPGRIPIQWNARKARLRKAEMDALGGREDRVGRRLTMSTPTNDDTLARAERLGLIQYSEEPATSLARLIALEAEHRLATEDMLVGKGDLDVETRAHWAWEANMFERANGDWADARVARTWKAKE